MSRVYARREDDDRRVLVEIGCDAPGCSATIKPNPKISDSGWVKFGTIELHGGLIVGSSLDGDYCPDHAHLAPQGGA